jgi:heat shock protein HslJ
MTLADAPMAYEPRTRRHFPVLMADAYPLLEQAYRESGLRPPAHLPVVIQGRWALAKAPDSPDKKLHLKIAAVEKIIPGKPTFCPLANLTETFWALESLNGQAITTGEGQREINLRLRQNGDVFGLAGCNRFSGAYQRRADNLSFGKLATTRMMCPDRGDLEDRYLEMLETVRRFAIEGETLYLMDDAGRDLAIFESRYFD